MSRVLVIGDIHGGFKGLKQALERAQVDYENDVVIQLGDVADGWSETYECVEELLKIVNLIPIQGNHDQTFNQWIKTGAHPYNWSQGALATLKSYTTKIGFPLAVETTYELDAFGQKQALHMTNAIPELIPDLHKDFFRKQIQFYKDDKGRVFTHAGFDRRLTLRGQVDTRLFAWDRSLFLEALSVKGKDNLKFEEPGLTEVYIGHTTTTKWGIDHPIKANKVWNIDTGGGFNGKITIMDIDTKTFWQSDIVMDLYPDEQGRYVRRKIKALPQ